MVTLIKEANVSFCHDLQYIHSVFKANHSQKAVGDLLLEFFYFYLFEFDYNSKVININSNSMTSTQSPEVVNQPFEDYLMMFHTQFD